MGKHYTVASGLAEARTNATSNGCHPWPGNINHSGYGRIRVGGVLKRAHRAAWELQRGPVPDGLDLDHTCHGLDLSCVGGPSCLHRRCVNLDHLEAVEWLENWERGRSLSRKARDKRTCNKGHWFTPENTYRHRGKGGRIYRRCRTCILDQNRASRLRNIA